MPSISHEAFIALFQNRPELAPELLRDVLHVTLPAYAEARIESADLTDIDPAEYRADLVILLVDGKPVLGIIVEVQLQEANRKRFTWPAYVANLRARLECDACVLVVTPSDKIATWARSRVLLGPGSTFEPLVIGPSSVPVVRDVDVAIANPELAVLSAMAHGHRETELAVAIASAAFAAARGLDEERSMFYLDLIETSLSEAARAAFEDLMATGNYEFQGTTAKKLQAKGEAIGEAKGEAIGEAKGVLKFLAARRIPVSDEQKARILACTDIAVLDRWIEKAVSVSAADQLFTD